jgi:hypothetical protein
VEVAPPVAAVDVFAVELGKRLAAQEAGPLRGPAVPSSRARSAARL